MLRTPLVFLSRFSVAKGGISTGPFTIRLHPYHSPDSGPVNLRQSPPLPPSQAIASAPAEMAPAMVCPLSSSQDSLSWSSASSIVVTIVHLPLPQLQLPAGEASKSEVRQFTVNPAFAGSLGFEK